MSSNIKTRNSTNKYLIRQPTKLPGNQLPIKKDVLRAFELEVNELGSEKITSLQRKLVLTKLTDELHENWKRASIPVIDKKQILMMVERLIAEYKSKLKHISQKKDKPEAPKILAYLADLDDLFDLGCCSCFKSKFGKPVDPASLNYTDCSCKSKIPAGEWDIYIDQIAERKLIISNSIDEKVTKEMRKKEQRIKSRN